MHETNNLYKIIIRSDVSPQKTTVWLPPYFLYSLGFSPIMLDKLTNSILAVLPEINFLFCTKLNVTCLGRKIQNITTTPV